MGKVLELPRKKSTTPSKKSFSAASKQENTRSLFWALLEEDKFFIEIIKSWPCFAPLGPDIQTNELIHKYCKNKLNQSQECVVDLLLHIHDSSFIFDINCSLSVWKKADRDFFLYFMEQHAEVLSE